RQLKYATKITDWETPHTIYGSLMKLAGDVFGCFGQIPCCCCFANPMKVVEQGTVGLIKRFGQAIEIVDPGLHEINVMTDSLQKVDIRMQVVDMPRQMVLTKDNIQVNIDTVLYYQVKDPYVSAFMISNVRMALVERTQTVMRQIFGLRTLQECIEMRESIANAMTQHMQGPAADWGVHVSSILIKDLTLSPDLVESLSAVAKQKRIGESKVIAAEAEVAAAELMRKAADVLDSEAAMSFRFLDTLKHISATPGTRLVFVPAGAEGQRVVAEARMPEAMM
ncbi:hypothetical protein BCR44DRAFT_120136, partial [Catenaria anguillulae PL171]